MSDIVWVAIITGAFGIMQTILIFKLKDKVNLVHKEMNGMKETLIDNAREKGHAEGVKDEKNNNNSGKDFNS